MDTGTKARFDTAKDERAAGRIHDSKCDSADLRNRL